MKKRNFYKLDNILKHEAQYNIIISGRDIGKSFAVKKHLIEDAYKKSRLFVYLRRFDTDLKGYGAASYFDDLPISEITKGEYDNINYYNGWFYLSNYDEENNKIIRGKKIGRAVALNLQAKLKSQVFANVWNIVFEEFIVDKAYNYLENEPDKLQNLVSTIFRDRKGCVFLIGNTIDEYNPYFKEWQLVNVPYMQDWQIDDYYFERYDVVFEETITTKVSVEKCGSIGSNSNMFFGKSADSITGSSWQVGDFNKLEKSHTYYLTTYELKVESSYGPSFYLQLKVDRKTGGQFMYVYPYNEKREIRRIITKRFSADPFISNSWNISIDAECVMSNLLHQNKIAFSDNLTGQRFMKTIEELNL